MHLWLSRCKVTSHTFIGYHGACLFTYNCYKPLSRIFFLIVQLKELNLEPYLYQQVAQHIWRKSGVIKRFSHHLVLELSIGSGMCEYEPPAFCK